MKRRRGVGVSMPQNAVRPRPRHSWWDGVLAENRLTVGAALILRPGGFALLRKITPFGGGSEPVEWRSALAHGRLARRSWLSGFRGRKPHRLLPEHSQQTREQQ